jgi:D-alanine-D-alanine ligase
MTQRLRVGLMFGGRSVEHEVSVVSARGVSAALRGTEMECIPVGVTGDGRWLRPKDSWRLLEGEARRVERPAEDGESWRAVLDPGSGGLVLLGEGRAPERLALDVVFPLIHGWGGEDGRLQGALDLVGIPVVGAGVLGSAMAMDKAISKQLFLANGLPVAPWLSITRPLYDRRSERARKRIISELGLPLFVKPANGGSSVGINRVAHLEELEPALNEAFALDGKVVIEQALDAREIECAVLGNDNPEASGLGEILPAREFYDYAAKYEDDRSRLELPAKIEPALTESIRSLALSAFRALELRGFARVDFLLDRLSGRAYLNEANTLPGFTPISMFPKLWEASGVAFPDLVQRLVHLAQEHAADERRLRYRRVDD